MENQPEKLSVFLCHASEDKPKVRELCKQLRSDGFNPWLDEERLLPGQDWKLEIEKALRASQTILLCFSRKSLQKEGFVQKEIKHAMDIAEEKPEGTIFVIPVRLSKCEIPFRLQCLQWVDYPGQYVKLTAALNVRQSDLEAKTHKRTHKAPEKPDGAKSPPAPADLPPGSYLPFPRNSFFTGRVADLKKLSDALLGGHRPGMVINQAITGMGGLGKTQLAVEFAYQYGCRFEGVHWLDLREPEALDAQIALCGAKLGLPAWPQNQPEQVTATLRAWLADGPRLLILDNFEEIGAANQVLARLRHSTLCLLVTSRRSDWPAALGLSRLPLDEFTPPESLEFLRKYLPEGRASVPELNGLAEHLGHLPLALELAGRYLEKHSRMSIPDYLGKLGKALEHTSMQGWHPEQRSLTGHDLSLLQTFALSWEQVKDKKTRQMFLAAGYCAPNAPIPPEILETALGIKPEDCDEAGAALCGLGLLKEGPAIHPLLAQFARRLDKEQNVLKVLSEEFANLANQKNAEENRTGHYDLYLPILPHVRAVAENAENAGLGAGGSLWNSLGRHINILADYAGAKAAYERAIKIWEANLGPEHPQVATGVNNLGLVLQALGDLAGAKAAYERALKIDEATYGPDHPDVAIDVNNLGLVLKALGDLAGAKAAYERAIKIWEANLGPEHPQVATGVNNLGLVLQALGDLAGAKAAYERALKIDEATYGPDHPTVAIRVNNLGLVLKALGDLAGAKAAYERALKIFKQFLPPGHPNIRIVQENLESLG